MKIVTLDINKSRKICSNNNVIESCLCYHITLCYVLGLLVETRVLGKYLQIVENEEASLTEPPTVSTMKTDRRNLIRCYTYVYRRV